MLGKTIRLGTRSATIVGVLEPSVPYPAETELIANVVTSPHHLSATMVTGREHRMTELFGRLAPGADVESARAELRAVHGAHHQGAPGGVSGRRPTSASTPCGCAIRSRRARAPCCSSCSPRPALVFVIAVLERREPDSRAIGAARSRSWRCARRSARAAATLRRTLLAESLLLCGTGAVLGVAIARPMVAVLARYASRFSVRALDLTLDASMLWVGVGLALVAAVLLAFVPRLPYADASHGFALSSGGLRITGATNRRLRAVRGHADRGVVRAARRRRHAAADAARAAGGAARIRDRAACSPSTCR